MTLPEEELTIAGLRTIAIGDRASARMNVVLLHGFGMRPEELSPFAHSLGLPAWFLFPEAPLDASIGGRAWWFIDAADRETAIAKGPRDFAVQHPPDLPKAREHLTRLLDAVKEMTSDRPLIIAGFSQGGMLTCDTFLRAPRPVAGIALLSASRIAYRDWPPLLESGAVKDVPILVSHGELDADLAFSAGEALRDALTAGGANVTWVPFDQGHGIPLVVWRRFRKFALAVVS